MRGRGRFPARRRRRSRRECGRWPRSRGRSFWPTWRPSRRRHPSSAKTCVAKREKENQSRGNSWRERETGWPRSRFPILNRPGRRAQSWGERRHELQVSFPYVVGYAASVPVFVFPVFRIQRERGHASSVPHEVGPSNSPAVRPVPRLGRDTFAATVPGTSATTGDSCGPSGVGRAPRRAGECFRV